MEETEVDEPGVNEYSESAWYENNKKLPCDHKDVDLCKIPHLATMLPEGYDQKLCDYVPVEGDEKFTLTLRLNVSTKEEITLWLQNFEERSITSYVLDKSTNEGSGRLYKLMYRCKLQTYRAAKRQNKEQDHEGCPARITVSIRNPGHRVNNRRHPHADTHPTHMRISFIHNHPLDTPEFRSKRKLCPQLKERFESMFKQGMKPRDALNQHKWELQSQLGPEKYLEVALDGFYMPTMGRLCSMYKRITGTTSIKTNTKRISKNNPDADRFSYESCNFAAQSATGFMEEEEEESAESEAESGDKEDKSSFPIKRDENVCSHSSHWNVNPVNAASLQEAQPGPTNAGLSGYDMNRVHTDHHQQQLTVSAPVLTFQNMESLSFDTIAKSYKMDDGLRGSGIPSSALSSVASHHHHHHHQHSMTPGLSSRPHSQLPDSYLAGPSNRFPLPPAMDLRQVSSHSSHHMAHQALQGFPQYHSGHSHGVPGFDHHTPSYFYDQGPLGRTSSSSSQLAFPHHPAANLVPQTPPLQREEHYRPSTEIPVSTLYQREHLPQANPLSQSYQIHNNNDNKVESTVLNSPTSEPVKTPPSNEKRKSSETTTTPEGDKKKKRKTPTHTYSVKRFRETLMSSTSTVQPSTQVSAQEALQNIILADKSRAIEERLSSFYSALEQTMDLDPKLFVPALSKFLDTWNRLSGEELATALRDFGTTKQEVVKEYQGKKYLNSRDKGVQSVRTLTSKPICFSKACQTSEEISTIPSAENDGRTQSKKAEPLPSVRSVRSRGVTYMYIDPGDPADGRTKSKRKGCRNKRPRQIRKTPARKAKSVDINKPSNANPEIKKLLDNKASRPLPCDNKLRKGNGRETGEERRQICLRTTRSREKKKSMVVETEVGEGDEVHQLESSSPSVLGEGNHEGIQTGPGTEADSTPETKDEAPSNTSGSSLALPSKSPCVHSVPFKVHTDGEECDQSGSDTEIEDNIEQSEVQS